MEVIPETPADVRDAAYRAFCAAREPLDSSARAARARDRIRNVQSARGIEGLPTELRALWDWHADNEAGFSAASFEEQKATFLFIQAEDAVPELGIPARRGRRGHDAFHAAGAALLAWWQGQGRAVTANLGPDREKLQPSEAVSFLAAEFLRIADRYAAAPVATFDAPQDTFADPEANYLLRRVRASALNIGFDVAERYNQNRTAKR